MNDRKQPPVDKLTKKIHQWKETYGKNIAKGSELEKAIEQLHFDKAELNKKILQIQSEKEGFITEIQQLKAENKTLKSNVKELEERLFQAGKQTFLIRQPPPRNLIRILMKFLTHEIKILSYCINYLTTSEDSDHYSRCNFDFKT